MAKAITKTVAKPTAEKTGLEQKFDLVRTLQSGQCFRYTISDSKIIVLNGSQRFVFEKEMRGKKTGSGNTEPGKWIIPQDDATIRFLRLDRGHDDAISVLRNDPKIRGIVNQYSQIRVLRQDLHETIIAFIISSNNNITRITRSMQAIAPNKLPEPGDLLDQSLLKEYGLGYRAPHLAATNAELTPEFLNMLKRSDYSTAHEMLQELPGIGPKVADCVCLFGLDLTEAFPVDVHILRAMQHLFPEEKFKNEKEAKLFAMKRWGVHAGIAQQFIFEWAKDNLRKKQD